MMSNLPPIDVREQVFKSIDIHILSQLHQEPILATLIRDYNLVVNFQAAVLDKKATGGGWFNLSLAGTQPDLDRAFAYLRNLGVEIFAHS